VVVLRHDVEAFIPLTEADVVVEHLSVAPVGSLAGTDKVIGKAPWRALAAGTWLSDESFNQGGPLSRMIRKDERALAVAVDEVVGAAGQMSPGDFVDVMLYLREDQHNPQQSAQVVVPALRVLSIGDQLGPTNDGHPAPALPEDKNRRVPRTVVLAVPEQLVSRMMLAVQAGTLRLAVRSADEQLLARYWAGDGQATPVESTNRDLLRFSQLAMAGPVAPSRPELPVMRGRPAVEVIRGNQITQQTP
jgi:pilus assembly protein CpaB